MIRSIRKKFTHWLKTQPYIRARTTLPVRPKSALFQSFHGRSVSDHPFYLMRELSQRGDHEIFVAARDVSAAKAVLHTYGLQAQVVEIGSAQYQLRLATCELLVNNSTFPSYFIKRSNQVYLNTWHGTPLKTLGRAMPRWLDDLPNVQSNFLKADYLLYTNEYTREKMMRDYMTEDVYGGTILMKGSPRNEVFHDLSRRAELRKQLELEGKRVYIYMPTWRGENARTLQIQRYQEVVEEQLKALNDALADDCVLLVKFHSLIADTISLAQMNRVRLAPTTYETYDLLNVADTLITDYSSVMFDFSVTEREILLFPYDFEEYTADRGFYFDYGELPFKKLATVEQLARHIKQSEPFVVDPAYLRFIDQYCSHDKSGVSKELLGMLTLTQHALASSSESETSAEVVFIAAPVSPKAQKEMRALINNGMNRRDVIFAFQFKGHSRKIETFIRSLEETEPLRAKLLPMRGTLQLTELQALAMIPFKLSNLYSSATHSAFSAEVSRLFGEVRLSKASSQLNNRRIKALVRCINTNAARASTPHAARTTSSSPLN